MARRSGIRKWKACIGQKPMFVPDSDWVAPNLDDLPSWKGIPRIGLDTEGRDPTLTTLGPGVRRDGYTCGISFAIEDGPAFYLPMRHHGGGNLNPDRVEQYMKDQAATYTGAICGANLQYDLDYLAERDIVFRHATFLDIQVAEPLIDENQLSYGLETLALKYGFLGKEETLLQEAASAYGWTGNDVKKNMWQLPARFVGPYAAEDAVLPLKILRKQEKIIDDQDIWDIYRLECRVLPVLVKMRRRGVRIDFDQLERVEALTRIKEQEYLDIIYAETGVRIRVDEINKGKLVIAALDVAQIPYGRTEPTEKFPEGHASVKKEFLEPNKEMPVVNAILEARSYNKVRNTFVKSIRNHETNGRIHATFNQLRTQQDNSDDVKGVGPGRLSACNPNPQQSPTRHPVLGKMWRSIYLPDEGGRWASLDYCFSADTEVLTENGFVPFPELSKDVKVAQYHPNGLVTYAMPEAYQAVPYSGEMYHIHGQRQVDLLVSPNHRCALLTPDGRLSFQRADEDWSGGKIIPQNGMALGTLSMPKAVVQQAAIIQADGSYRNSHYRVFVKKDRKIKRLSSVLGRAEDYICRGKTAGHAFKLKLNPLVIPGKQKLFNREKLIALRPSLRMLFLNELLHWDGTLSSDVYYTTVRENAEIVQEVATLTGLRSNCVCDPQPNGWSSLYTVSLNPRTGTYVKTLEKSAVSYDGTIYCVTMPASTVIVRRNGRVAVCGQSQAEPRLFIHYAHIAGCAGTQAAIDGFHAGLDWHDMTTELAFGVKKADDPVKFAKLRKRAKAVFLGCIAAGTKITTSDGLKPIEAVSRKDLIWDGISWVSHGGVVFKGIKPCIQIKNEWMTPDHEVLTEEGWFQGQDVYMNPRLLGPPMETSPSSALLMENAAGSSPSSVGARVIKHVLHSETIWCRANQHAALSVVKNLLLRNVHDLHTNSLKNHIVVAFLIESLRSSADAIRGHMSGTENAESLYTRTGETIESYFSNISCLSPDGIILTSKLIEATTKKDIFLEILDLLHMQKICVTLQDIVPIVWALLQNVRRVKLSSLGRKPAKHIAPGPVPHSVNLPVYDILDAGPYSRYQTRNSIVSNCVYGMGQAKMCHSCGFSTEFVNIRGAEREVAGPEGKRFLAEFNAKVPFLSEIRDMVERVAWNRKYIRTILGRRIHYPPGAGAERKALNNLIQGSSADQMKLAMVLMDEQNFRIQLQIHDEVDITIYEEQTAKDMAQIMTECVPLVVPSKVDIEIGNSWGGSMK